MVGAQDCAGREGQERPCNLRCRWGGHPANHVKLPAPPTTRIPFLSRPLLALPPPPKKARSPPPPRRSPPPPPKRPPPSTPVEDARGGADPYRRGNFVVGVVVGSWGAELAAGPGLQCSAVQCSAVQCSAVQRWLHTCSACSAACPASRRALTTSASCARARATSGTPSLPAPSSSLPSRRGCVGWGGPAAASAPMLQNKSQGHGAVRCR